jgi:hypothetical protein
VGAVLPNKIIKKVIHLEGMLRSGGRDPGIYNLDSRYMWVVSFTSQPLNLPTVSTDKQAVNLNILEERNIRFPY